MTKSKKIRNAMIKQIKARGFIKNGKYYQKDSYRFKFEDKSYRYERFINIWIKIDENKYKDIEV